MPKSAGRRIGEQLAVEVALEGSVRRDGTRLRVTAQLNKASDGYHLWSKRFDCEMKDIFQVQDEISLATVDTLESSAAPQGPPTAQGPTTIFHRAGAW